jgi:hypothetical protein
MFMSEKLQNIVGSVTLNVKRLEEFVDRRLPHDALWPAPRLVDRVIVHTDLAEGGHALRSLSFEWVLKWKPPVDNLARTNHCVNNR